MARSISTRDTIISVFKQVAADQGRTLAPISDTLKMTDCGLDSLGIAVVVATLEDTLGVDPFSTTEWAEFPVTLADFIQLYDLAVA